MENFFRIDPRDDTMTDYPSDVVRPIFKVTKVRGASDSATANIASIFLDGYIENYQQFKDSFAQKGIDTSVSVFLALDSGGVYRVVLFREGVIQHLKAAAGWYMPEYVVTDFQKWSKINFTLYGLWGWNLPDCFQIDPPLYFCDVYVPSPNDIFNPDPLCPYTNLQFTVSPPIPEVSWAVIIPLAVFGIGALAYWYLKRRK